MRKTRAAAMIAPLALAPLAFGVPAHAADDGTYELPLTQLNDSGASGTAVVELDGTDLRVMIDASGMTPGAPHAQHIHGDTSGTNFTCPGPADVAELDEDGDGLLNTIEAASFYGPVHISLTTEGDTSMDSALAVERFPVADAEGNLHYERTIELTEATAENLTNLHIVQHGIDLNDDGEYNGDAPSSLDPALPLEATIPATCGAVELSQLQGTPTGGVETGGGTEQGGAALPLYVLGGAALAGAAGTLVLRRRTAATER